MASVSPRLHFPVINSPKYSPSTMTRTISTHPSLRVGQPCRAGYHESHLIPISRLQANYCKDRRRIRQTRCRGREPRTLESQPGHRRRCIRWRPQSPKGNARSFTSSIGWHPCPTRFHQVAVLTLELHSATLPPGKKIVFDLTDPSKLVDIRKNPVVIKEGVEYKRVSSLSPSSSISHFISVRITFKVNHSIISVWSSFAQISQWICSRERLGCSLYTSREESWSQR